MIDYCYLPNTKYDKALTHLGYKWCVATTGTSRLIKLQHGVNICRFLDTHNYAHYVFPHFVYEGPAAAVLYYAVLMYMYCCMS